MNKKEVNEIKKLFNPANCCISRICSCYVDSKKNKRTELKEAFLSLPEEEGFKYFTILKSALAGSVGKNLVNMDFPLNTEVDGGTQSFLLKLRNSQLKDDELIEEFYDKVIASYDYGENFYIILIHCAYDIPVRPSDGQELFDSSDFVYEFIQCVICPVKLSKAGLWYNTADNVIENRNRDWLVEAPETGFLFPSFSDRNTDIHSALYYLKKPEQIPERLINDLLGCMVPMTAKSQKETFHAIVEETLGENCDFNSVKGIHENLNEILEETKDETEPLNIDKHQIKRLLENNGASNEKLEEFERSYSNIDETLAPNFIASNIVNSKSFEIETADVVIKIAPDKTYLVENRMIDGRPCIVIALDDHVKINGITVRPIKS